MSWLLGLYAGAYGEGRNTKQREKASRSLCERPWAVQVGMVRRKACKNVHGRKRPTVGPMGAGRKEARGPSAVLAMIWAERPAEMAFLGLIWACSELGQWAQQKCDNEIHETTIN